MISEAKVREIILPYLEGKEVELITLRISSDNFILVEVDAYAGIDVDFCAELSRYVQDHLDREEEDYDLEVGSVSLTDPFKTLMQYRKHVGHPVEILTKEGKKLHGELVNVEEDYFEADCEVMVEVELKTGRRKKQRQVQTLRFAYPDIKSCSYDLKV